MKKFQSDKLEPKADKCIFIGYPKIVGYISYLRSESKVFVSRNGSFLEERFLSKELSGRVVELDEVIEPSLQPVCSRAQEVVPVAPTPIEVKADDGDHRASNQVTTNLVG